MPRRARLDAPGALHHVMFRGVNRGRIFLDDNDNYRWRPHRVSASMDDAPFMDRAFVLSQFSAARKKAVYACRRFMEEGIALGCKPELVGGGLIRSLGGWSQVRSAGSKGAGKGDERILGSPQFVLQVLAEAEERQRKQIRAPEKSIDEMIEQECAQRELSSQELRNGGRRPKATAARMFIAYRALAELGPSAAEAARCLGVAASTITRAVAKNENGIK